MKKNSKNHCNYIGNILQNNCAEIIFYTIIQCFEYLCYFYALFVVVISVFKTDIFNKTFPRDRLILGHSINLSLTYILIADVIKTIRIPSYYQLGRLVILVILREFITYFLDDEITFLKKYKN